MGKKIKDYSAIELASLEVAKKYEEFYNTTTSAEFCELYTEDCIVNGAPVGRANLLKTEQGYHDFAPKRTMRIDARHVDGNVVAVQGVILNPDFGDDWSVPFSAFLTVEDGMITSDYTYAEFGNLIKRPKDKD